MAKGKRKPKSGPNNSQQEVEPTTRGTVKIVHDERYPEQKLAIKSEKLETASPTSSPAVSPLLESWLNFHNWFAIDSLSRPEHELRSLLRNLHHSLDVFASQLPGQLDPEGPHASICNIAKEAVASADTLGVFAKGMAALARKEPKLIKNETCVVMSAAFKKCVSVSRCYELREVLPRLPPVQVAPQAFERAVKLLRALCHFQKSYTLIGKFTDIYTTRGKLHFTCDMQPIVQYYFMYNPAPFSQCENERDMEAILATDGCDAVHSRLAPIIDFILGEAVSKSQEVCAFAPKNCPRLSATRFRNSLHNITKESELCTRHKMLLITLKDGKCFALDLTGAQYGWDETVLPWKEFYHTRVKTLTNCFSVEYHRYNSDMMIHFMKDCPLGGPDQLADREGKEIVVQAMLDRIKIWLKEEGLDMKAFLEVGEGYDMKAFELALFVVQGIETTVRQLKRDNKFYYYRGKDGKPAYATR
ncbi:hypothetical protein BLS_002897 [Venturia inaequalis]|uniref:Uncharacterized protein n=1 Tax=Venturia inaequalis TaxID=5025 RepID=A0A8H3YUX2_VENIN|nr:hypothetical protein BLS_002897 [Venturia inaequalis]